MSVYTPLTEKEALKLLDGTDVLDPEWRKKLLPELLALDESIVDYECHNSFFVSYQERVFEDYARYESSMKHVMLHVDEWRQEVLADNKEYTPTMAKEDQQFFEEHYKQQLERNLAISETCRNDLHNYAYALIIDWKKYGGQSSGWSLTEAFSYKGLKRRTNQFKEELIQVTLHQNRIKRLQAQYNDDSHLIRVTNNYDMTME